MKKTSLLLLLVIYTVSVFGIGVREFYCCGKLQSVHISFIQEAKEKATKGESAMGGCCKTTHTFFKVRDNHKAADNFSHLSVPVVHLQALFTVFNEPVYFRDQVTVANATHAPPGDESVPIYLSNRVFRV
jgi:hypothetical protein